MKNDITKKIKYKIGDKVRVKINKKIFDKGYEQNFSNEVCIINKIFKSNPVTYQVKDSNNHIIKGKYYEELVLFTGNKRKGSGCGANIV